LAKKFIIDCSKKIGYNFCMTIKKQELSFQQRIHAKRQEIREYEKVLERYRTDRGQARWYNYGLRSLETLNSELDVLQQKNKRRIRLNLSSVRPLFSKVSKRKESAPTQRSSAPAGLRM